jgi:FixJ family two-component response regulator
MDESETQIVSVVDDDESLRRSLKNLLGSVGFRVEAFASAEAFLQSTHQEQTSCLLLDLRLPGMNGFDLLRHLSGRGSTIPTVILTAHGDDDEARQRSLQAGAVAFLSKPFDGNALLDVIRTALKQGGAPSRLRRSAHPLTARLRSRLRSIRRREL